MGRRQRSWCGVPIGLFPSRSKCSVNVTSFNKNPLIVIDSLRLSIIIIFFIFYSFYFIHFFFQLLLLLLDDYLY